MSSTIAPLQVMSYRDALLKKPSPEPSSSLIPSKTIITDAAFDKKPNLNSSRKPSSIPKWHLRRGPFNVRKMRLRQIKKYLTEIHNLFYRISNLTITEDYYTEIPHRDTSLILTEVDDFDEKLNLDSSIVIKNIDACEQLSYVTRSLGPHGRNKLVYQLFMSGLVDQHPSAKRLVLAAKEQHEKFGDGANLVVSIAWKHLQGAKELITNDGLNPSQIFHAYNKATSKLVQILQALVEEGSETMDVRNIDQVILRIKAPVSSKLFLFQDILCPLIAEACIQVCPKDPVDFNADDVRVAKLLDAPPGASKTFRGMVLKAATVYGSIKRVENAKVLVIAAGGDNTTAIEVGKYAKIKEAEVAELIKESGANVIVIGAGLGQTVLHFCNLDEILVLEISSQVELDCFRRTTNAVSLLKLGSTDPYLGYVDSILVEETPDSSSRVTVTNEKGGVATVLLGLEANIISDEQLEGAVVNVVNSYKTLCWDSRIVPGAGATEIEIARRLREFAYEEPGSSDQIAIAKYAESFEVIPKTLAQNARLNVKGIIKTLYAAHKAGNVKVGIDLIDEDCKDASTLNIWDLYATKYQALLYAADVVCNAFCVDQDKEPQSEFDHLMATNHKGGESLWNYLMSEHDVNSQSLWQYEFLTQHLNTIFYASIWENNLQPKRETEMLALTSHKDKLYKLSSDGLLSSIDIRSSEVCWSIPTSIELDLDFSNKSSDCSYFVASPRVFIHTKEKKPVNYSYHKYEVLETLFKLSGEEIIPSRLVTQIYVDPVKGCCISPLSSDCDEILCIRVIHSQLVSYKPWTSIVLWYEKVATFYICIVCREEGVKLQQKQQQQPQQQQKGLEN